MEPYTIYIDMPVTRRKRFNYLVDANNETLFTDISATKVIEHLRSFYDGPFILVAGKNTFAVETVDDLD